MIEFFNDIGDIAECLDSFSVSDYTESKVPYSYDVNIRSLILKGPIISE